MFFQVVFQLFFTIGFSSLQTYSIVKYCNMQTLIFSQKQLNAVFLSQFVLRMSSNKLRKLINEMKICDLTAFSLVPTKLLFVSFALLL